MNLNINISYFALKSKPNLLHPLNTKRKQYLCQEKLYETDWKFRNLKEIIQIDDGFQQFKNEVFKTVEKYYNQQCTLQQVKQMLQHVKTVFQKCSYYNVILSNEDIFTHQYGLFSLLRHPQDINICLLVTQIQRISKTFQQPNKFSQISFQFPYISQLQEISVKQLITILKQLKQNMFIPNGDLFYHLASKLNIQYNQQLSLRENLFNNKEKLSNQQQFNDKIYYQLLIYKSCESLQGLCGYLAFVKNIILDRKSGALSTDHDTWVFIYDACLRLYVRNQQVRKNSWLEIDQILSSTFNDDEFTNFLMKSGVEDFSLESLNFYCKNLSKSEQQKLLKVVQNKIIHLLSSPQVWKSAQDIVQHLDSQCPASSKQKIFNQIIHIINNLFVSQQIQNTTDLFQIQIGLSFFIQSMCKHLLITQKIFNLKNISIICKILKQTPKQYQSKIKLLYHIFTQFIVNSYQQSDELSSYLQQPQNSSLISDIFPEMIQLFNYHGYMMPKQFYKLIIHSCNSTDISKISNKIWRGIAELYFIQAFQETIDMEIFHTDDQAKRFISDEIIEILKELAISSGKEEIQISHILQINSQKQQRQNIVSSFFAVKAFKDELIFNNLLIMSTFFGQYLPLTDLSSFLNQLYSPLVNDIKWKSGQNQTLTLMSFVSEQLPIDILKTSYKYLKETFSINWQQLSSLSPNFWNLYLSYQEQQNSHSKVKAIIQQKSFSFTQYKNLHSLRKLDLILNMINCVFDKLNTQSQKSIKQLKIMYQWGVQYIKQIEPILYPILIQCVSNKFLQLSKTLTQQNMQNFNLCSNNNISVLELHLTEKYHLYQTFHDFNKIGFVIEHERFNEVAMLLYPTVWINNKGNKQIKKIGEEEMKEILTEEMFLNKIMKIYSLVENSCLQQVINQEYLNKVAENNINAQNYFQKASIIFQNLRTMLLVSTQKFQFKSFLQKSLYKRLISHLKLLIGKIYVPFLYKNAFKQTTTNNETQPKQSSLQKQKKLQNKFNLIKCVVQVLNIFDISFQDHFAELMLVIQQNCQNQSKDALLATNNKTQHEIFYLKSTIIIKTLQMFIKCVLSNIKVRSYHIFRLIKLYLKFSNTPLESINQVISFYVNLMFKEFIKVKGSNGKVYNEEVNQKCLMEKSQNNLNKESRCIILNHASSRINNTSDISFADRILSPLKRQKISLQQLKVKKALKSPFHTPNKLSQKKNKQNISSPNSSDIQINATKQQYEQESSSKQEQLESKIQKTISPELKRLLIKKHNLSMVECSCTLSMFFNLFARLNYTSLPVGIQAMLAREDDKEVYLDYLTELTQKIYRYQQTSASSSSQHKSQIYIIANRDMQILNVDVYGNISFILKGKITEQIINKFINLSKSILKIKSLNQSIVNLPIKLLNQGVFNMAVQNHSRFGISQKQGLLQAQTQDFSKLTKLIESFENEPLAFDLGLKSHLMKILPNIQSNLHFCNLKYIIGNSNAKMAKKIFQTNFKLVQMLMGGKKQARQFISKYDQENKNSSAPKKNKNSPLQEYKQPSVSIFPLAIKQMQLVLQKFFNCFIKLQSVQFNKLQKQAQQKIISEFYFQFRKICSIIFYVPELFSFVLNKTFKVTNLSRSSEQEEGNITFVDVLFTTLQKGTLVMFSQFYLLSLKINSGFSTRQKVVQILKTSLDISDLQQKHITPTQKLFQQIPQTIPFNLLFQIIIKIKLYNLVSKNSKQIKLYLLRALNFTIKTSQSYRFRFYKFIRLNSQENQNFVKRVDQFILNSLLGRLTVMGTERQTYGQKIYKSEKNCTSGQSFISKLQLLDTCLQNHFSTTMIDYAKMKLDQKLKQTFNTSQYSLKCLKSFNNCEIATLKVLEQDEGQKSSVSSTDNIMIADDMQFNNEMANDSVKIKINVINGEKIAQMRYNHPISGKNIMIDGLIMEQVENEQTNNAQDLQKIEINLHESSFECSKLFSIFKIDQSIVQSTQKMQKQDSFFIRNINTTPNPKPSSNCTSFLSILSQSEPLSIKQTSQIKSWLNNSFTSFKKSQNLLNQICLKQMQKNCQKLIGKQNLTFEEQGIVYLTNHIHSNNNSSNHSSSGQSDVEITAFMVGDGSMVDCCIDEISFDDINSNNPNNGMIIQSSEQIQHLQNQHNNNILFGSDSIIDHQHQQQEQYDGIIEQQDDGQQQNGDQNQIKISEDCYSGQLNKLTSIEYNTCLLSNNNSLNENEMFQNQYGDQICQDQDDQDESDIQIQQQQYKGESDGSIQFTSSIKTLDNLDNIQEIGSVKESGVEDLGSQQINQEPQQYQITINSQARQYHYTIDNLTRNQRSSQLRQGDGNVENLSLVDAISAQNIINSRHADEDDNSSPVTKQSIITLIQQYTLNPQILKTIKLKLKKISNSELKKIHSLAHGQLAQQIQKQMRHRGIFIPVMNSHTNQHDSTGSLFSISKLINQSFQIDESKFYSVNYKKCDKKIQEKEKIQQIPILQFKQWIEFVFLYIFKKKQKEQEQVNEISGKTFLQVKSLSDLLLKLVLKKDNLIAFLEVLLNLLSFKTYQQIEKFTQSYNKHISFQSLPNPQNFIKQMTSFILNDLISKLILNRIGLSVIFKGKWNYETKKLIRYEFQCLFSDSNLNNTKSQDEPMLEVLLRKAIEMTYFNQMEIKNASSEEQRKVERYSVQQFLKNLSDYFKNASNFQTNQFPYYFIQDTVKLSHTTTLKNTFLRLNKLSTTKAKQSKSHSTTGLTQTLLNTMKQSSIQSLKQYQQIFCLMNYLDFETFSEFLQLLIESNKVLCDKILDKELNILKRFKKTINTQTLSKQKLAELYWHMRKSSKHSLLTQNEQKQLAFFSSIISNFASSIFLKFKQSIFRFGYGKQQNKKKQKISYLNKLLLNPSYQNKYKQIKEQISQHEKQYLIWKSYKTTEILKEDILPIIEKISSSFNGCLKKWEFFFDQLYDVFGNQRQEKVIIYKQCSEFYKIFLSFQLLLQQEEKALMRSMSSLKTKPSLQSSKDMLGITGRRRSSLSLPRVSLSLPQTTFKSVIKQIAPKFSFFSQMIEPTCPELRVHSKYSSLQSKLKLLHQPNKGGQLTIQVKRQSIWQDTLPYLNQEIGEKNVKIKIADELGLDYGGIRRQWITLIVKQLMNPNLGLFELSANGLSFQPSSLSHLIPNHLYHFHKFGILIGKALKQNWLLEINFTKSFLKHLLGFTLYVQDLQDIDPQSTKSMLWILNNQIGMDGDLGMDFTFENNKLGKKETVELVEGGKEIFVNDENKKEYVKKLATYKMTQQIRQQAKALMSGIEKIVPYQVLKLFSYKELGMYLAGMPTVDVQQMKKYARYEGFNKQHQTIEWFWQTLSKHTEQKKANFLFFLTGSYKVPYGGFKQHPICINKMPASIDYLPVAHTCFSVIDLPEYTTIQKLANLLDTAITQGKGFSVS